MLECLPEQPPSKTKVLPHFKIRFILIEGSLKYFNQFPIIDMANLQSVSVSGIDLLNGFGFAFFALVESIEDPVVLILQLAMRFEPIAVRLNQTNKQKKYKGGFAGSLFP